MSGWTYAEHGVEIVRGVFSADEVAAWIAHYDALRREGPKPLDYAGEDVAPDDPLAEWPRMVHMHRWDDVSARFLLDDRLRELLTDRLGAEPYASQSMLYFKPPGARGQALHQDQHYLRASGGTSVAVWVALDEATVASGCLHFVLGRREPLPHGAVATADSFTDQGIVDPSALPEPAPAELAPGDLVLFAGDVPHGSPPNRSDRFRRALIGHYLTAGVRRLQPYYLPALRFDGTEADEIVSGAAG